MEMRATLYIVGAAIEFLGIVLVASPDLFPEGRRLSGALGTVFWRIAHPVLRRLGFRRDQVIKLGAAGTIELAGSMTLRVSVNQDASTEEKVEFLLRRDQEQQARLNEIDEQLTALRRAMGQRFEDAQETMARHVSRALTSAHGEYLALRITGAVALVIGLGLATAANFVD